MRFSIPRSDAPIFPKKGGFAVRSLADLRNTPCKVGGKSGHIAMETACPAFFHFLKTRTGIRRLGRIGQIPDPRPEQPCLSVLLNRFTNLSSVT